MPFARAITDVARTFPWKRRNGCTPVGYSGRVAIRMEQCDMTAEGRNIIDRKDVNCWVTTGEYAPTATDTHTIEVIVVTYKGIQ
jgi:hypothetical protein